MAIDVEAIIMNALLDLVEGEGLPLERVTVKRLLEASGVSRQTFYNHFLNKNDLVARVYDRCIVGEFDVENAPAHLEFRQALVASLERMRVHAAFLQQALRMTDQNNLTEPYLGAQSRLRPRMAPAPVGYGLHARSPALCHRVPCHG